MSEIDWDTPERALQYDQNCDNQFNKGTVLIEMMGIKTGDQVLDIGCGTGQQAVHVLGIIGASGHLTGIDPSSHRITLAQKKFYENPYPNIQFLVGRAESLSSLPDASRDHAYFCSSFHWVDDKKKALSEVMRILKSGGSVGMTTRDGNAPHSLNPILNSIFTKYHLPCPREPHRGTRPVTAQELHELLNEAGFKEIIIEPRIIPWQYQDSSGRHRISKRVDGLLNEVPVNIREQVRAEICEELIRNHAQYHPGVRNITLFALATKFR